MLTDKNAIKNEVKTSKATKNLASLASNCNPSPVANQPKTGRVATDAKIAQTNSPSGSLPQPQTNQYRSQANAINQNVSLKNQTKPACKTQIIVQCDVGYNNHLFIRGKGANLNWDKGHPLKNVKPNEWIWECDENFDRCEFKILVNDSHYEQGGNRSIQAGHCMNYAPQF